MTVTSDARSVALVGLPLAVVVTTCIFLLLAVIGIGVRIFVGYRRKLLGLDDGLVLLSGLIFVAVFGLTVHASTMGVGTKNIDLNPWLQAQAEKFYMIWILMYLSGMVMIKSSICVTLLRILPPFQQKMRICTWVLMGLAWSAWCVAFFGVLLLCRPIEANWNTALVTEGKAKCGSTSVLVGISQTVTACSITTDIGCTVLPGVMLWHTRMAKTMSLQVFALLSIASIASVATIARAPFLSHYADPTNNLMYYCGYMVIFSNVETGIGCFASSLPAIRRLYFMLYDGSNSNQEPSQGQHDDGLITIGGTEMMKGSKRNTRAVGSVFVNPTDLGVSETHVEGGQGDWTSLTDEGSDKDILVSGHNKRSIRADYTYSVEMHSRA